jgi:hypothetical protein
MSIETINPLLNKRGAKAKASKVKSFGDGQSDFSGTMLDAAGAMTGTAATATGLYGDVNSSTVLAAAFSGVNSYNAQAGGSAPYFASGGMGGLSSGVGGSLLPAGSGGSVIPGTENYTQMDMINTMNQNNLQLLELQAVLQSNMQSWNTKSNILSADHRARMAIVEKFTAR